MKRALSSLKAKRDLQSAPSLTSTRSSGGQPGELKSNSKLISTISCNRGRDYNNRERYGIPIATDTNLNLPDIVINNYKCECSCKNKKNEEIQVSLSPEEELASIETQLS